MFRKRKNIFNELLKGLVSGTAQKEEKFYTLAIINMLLFLKKLIFSRLSLDSYPALPHLLLPLLHPKVHKLWMTVKNSRPFQHLMNCFQLF